MRCHEAAERISRTCQEAELRARPDLESHLQSCPRCRETWRLHLRILEDLSVPPPVPDFGDLAPGLLEKLGASGTSRAPWRWAAAAALALASLALGYLFGAMSAGAAGRQDAMAAAYEEAFEALPNGQAEVAYMEQNGDLRPDGSPGSEP